MRHFPSARSIRIALSVFLFGAALAGVSAASDNTVLFDFDGDGKTDPSVYRPGVWTATQRTNGTFYYLGSADGTIHGFNWGLGGDRIAVADYDADGKTDFAVHRSWDDNLEFPWDASDYWIWLTSQQISQTRYFLGYGPIMSRNFFAGPEAEVAVLTKRLVDQDPNENCFIERLYISIEGNYFFSDLTNECLTNTVRRTPAMGDYNGDGYSDIGVLVRDLESPTPATRFEAWFSPLTSGFTAPDVVKSMRVEFPAPGDYDGDYKTDFAGGYYRDGRLFWRLHYSYWNATVEFVFGLEGDKPVPGDYDGDGMTDPAVYRPSDGTWYIWRTSDNAWDVHRLGVSTDIPLPYPNAF